MINRHLAILISAVIACVAVIYYRYLPFIVVIDTFGFEKNAGFAALLLLGLLATLLVWVSAGLPGRQEIVAWGLYLLFALYIFAHSVVVPAQLNDVQSLIVLSVLNPVFALLALGQAPHKRWFLLFLMIACSSYMVFGLQAAAIAKMDDVVKITEAFDNLFPTDSTHWESFASHQNISLFLGMLFVGFIVFSLDRGGATGLLLGVVAFGALSLMLLAGGRTATGAAVIMLALIFCDHVARRNTLLFLVVLAVMVGLIAYLLTMDTSVIEAQIAKSNSYTAKRFLDMFDEEDASMRGFLFSSAWELYVKSPVNMIFGAGMNSAPVFNGSNNIDMYPHNIVLELLAEFGVVGLLLFSAPVLYVFIRRKRLLGSILGDTTAERAVAAITLFLGVVSMYTGSLRYTWPLVFFIFLCLPHRQDHDLSGYGESSHKRRKRRRRYFAPTS